jgi:aspartyl-tRNA(Asn)/glutamyl-tRNA(Gln) amidotransferase subunit C
MPDISRDEVAHLAMLARIDLDDAELDHLAPQLSVILESVASIAGVAGDDDAGRLLGRTRQLQDGELRQP